MVSTWCHMGLQICTVFAYFRICSCRNILYNCYWYCPLWSPVLIFTLDAAPHSGRTMLALLPCVLYIYITLRYNANHIGDQTFQQSVGCWSIWQNTNWKGRQIYSKIALLCPEIEAISSLWQQHHMNVDWLHHKQINMSFCIALLHTLHTKQHCMRWQMTRTHTQGNTICL